MRKRTLIAMTMAGGLLASTPAAAQKTACLVSDIGTGAAQAPTAGKGQGALTTDAVPQRLTPADRKAIVEDARKAVSRAQSEALQKFPKSGSGGILSLFSPSDVEKGSTLDKKRFAQARAFERVYLAPLLERNSLSCAELRGIVAAEPPASASTPPAASSPGGR